MNSPIVTTGTDWVSSTSAYTVLWPTTEGSVLFGSADKLSSSWRKFVHTPISHPSSGFVVTVISAERTTTPGPIVAKPTPLPEDYDARIESFQQFLDSLESEAHGIRNELQTSERKAVHKKSRNMEKGNK